MNGIIQTQLLDLSSNFIKFLPSLIVGIVLVMIGWLFGWFVKRIIIRIVAILRLERYLIRSRWRGEFSKADIRYGFYNLIGNVAFFIVLLVFVDNALAAWKLVTLSELLRRGILLFPKIIIALLVFGLGWMLSAWVEKAVYKELRREDIPRSLLVARFIKLMFILFFSAISLMELDIEREIVIIGFSVIFITCGAIAVVFAIFAGREFLKKEKNSGS